MRYILLLSVIVFSLSCQKEKTKIAKNKIVFCNKDIHVSTKKVICINSKNIELAKLLKLDNLYSLGIINSQIKDLNNLEKLKTLKHLVMINTNLNKIEDLSELNNISELYIGTYILNEFNSIETFSNNINTSNKFKIILSKLRKRLDYNYLYFKNDQDLIILLKLNDLNVKSINLLTYNNHPITLENITPIKNLYKLEKLSLHLKSDKYLSVLKSLKKLNELILSGNIKEIVKLPNSLEKLHLYNTHINDFSFLKDSSIKELNIITSKANKFNKLIKKYPNKKIKLLDSIFFSKTMSEQYNGRVIDDSSIKLSLTERRLISKKQLELTEINNVLMNIKYNGSFLSSKNDSLIKFVRNLIINKDWEYLFLSNSILLVKYLLDNYNISLNKLDNNKTILDNIIGEVDKDIINLLMNNGAKKGCEILKIKCEDVKDVSTKNK